MAEFTLRPTPIDTVALSWEVDVVLIEIVKFALYRRAHLDPNTQGAGVIYGR